jgi:hypothetical protein
MRWTVAHRLFFAGVMAVVSPRAVAHTRITERADGSLAMMRSAMMPPSMVPLALSFMFRVAAAQYDRTPPPGEHWYCCCGSGAQVGTPGPCTIDTYFDASNDGGYEYC